MPKSTHKCGYCKAQVKKGVKKCPKCKKEFGKKPETVKEVRLGDAFSQAGNLLGDNFKLILAILLTIYFPMNLVAAILNVDNFVFYKLGIAIILAFFGLFATIALVYLIGKAIDKKEVSYGESFKKAFSKWLPLAWTYVLFTVAVFFLSIVIIPGIIFAVYWSFVAFVVVLRNKKGIDALQYSKKVVKNNWRKVFADILLSGIVTILTKSTIDFFYGLAPAYYQFIMIPFKALFYTLMNIIGAFFMIVMLVLFVRLEKVKKVSSSYHLSVKK